jgi:hypothetical protein
VGCAGEISSISGLEKCLMHENGKTLHISLSEIAVATLLMSSGNFL